VRLSVLAHIGDLGEPGKGCRVHGREVGKFRAVQEVLLHIPDAGFDPTLFVSGGDVASGDLEGVMARVIDVAWIEHRAVPVRRRRTADFRLSTMILAGTPNTAKARSWQPRKCSMVCETVNSTYIWRE